MAGRTQITPRPTPHMSGGKRALFLALALVFDGLKTLFDFLVFTGPVMLGYFTNLYAGGGWSGWALGWAVTTATGAIEWLTPGAVFAIGIFGTMMAAFVSFFGWMLFVVLLWSADGKFFHRSSSNFLWVLGGWIMSEIPIINVLPTFTVSIWRMTGNIQKADRDALKKWETENAAQMKQLQAERQQKIAQAQANVAAREEEQAEYEEAEMEEAEESEAVLAETSPEESPEELPEYA